MRLVYKTGDSARASEILNLLRSNGIEASIHGKHTYNIRKYIPLGALSVWVHSNAQIEKAEEVLAELFEKEPSVTPGKNSFNPLAPKHIVLFLFIWIGLTIIGVFALG